jgi:hypothetical protein
MAEWAEQQGTGSNDVTSCSTEADDGTGTFTMISSNHGPPITPLQLAIPAEVITQRVTTRNSFCCLGHNTATHNSGSTTKCEEEDVIGWTIIATNAKNEAKPTVSVPEDLHSLINAILESEHCRHIEMIESRQEF